MTANHTAARPVKAFAHRAFWTEMRGNTRRVLVEPREAYTGILAARCPVSQRPALYLHTTPPAPTTTPRAAHGVFSEPSGAWMNRRLMPAAVISTRSLLGSAPVLVALVEQCPQRPDRRPCRRTEDVVEQRTSQIPRLTLARGGAVGSVGVVVVGSEVGSATGMASVSSSGAEGGKGGQRWASVGADAGKAVGADGHGFGSVGLGAGLE